MRLRLNVCVYVPAVGESGLGVSGSCVVSVDAFLFGSCENTHTKNRYVSINVISTGLGIHCLAFNI